MARSKIISTVQIVALIFLVVLSLNLPANISTPKAVTEKITSSSTETIMVTET